MNKAEIIKKLSDSTLKKKFIDNQIKNIRLFGSYVKGLENDDSDIDILYERDESLPNHSGLFGFFGLIADIKEILQKNVDFVSIKHLDGSIKKSVLDGKISIW